LAVIALQVTSSGEGAFHKLLPRSSRIFVEELPHFFTAHGVANISHSESAVDFLFLLIAVAVVNFEEGSLHSLVPTALQVPSLAPVQALVPNATITPVLSRHLVAAVVQSAESALAHPFNVFAYATEAPLVPSLQFVDLVTLTQTALAEEVHACLPAVSRYPTVAFLHLAPDPLALAAVHSALAFDAHPVLSLVNAFAV